MKRFFTSDNHFYHENIIRFCHRPFKSVEEMNEIMVLRWNEVVGINDVVYHLGDFSMAFRPVETFTRRLNGKKIIILGNHDFAFPAHKRGKQDQEKWIQKYLDNGFDEVKLEDTLTIGEHQVLLSHFPYKNEEGGDYEQRYLEYRPDNNGLILLHGHSHGRWIKKGSMIDVGVDAHNFYPINEDKVIELINTVGDIKTNLYDDKK